MPDEIKKSNFGGLMFLLVIFVASILIIFWFSFLNKPSRFISGETITIGQDSFIYVRAEKWTSRHGALAIIEVLSKFRQEHADLCVLPWHYETTSDAEGDVVSHGIWIHHRSKSSEGGC